MSIGSHKLPTNYRGLHLTPILSEVIERIIVRMAVISGHSGVDTTVETLLRFKYYDFYLLYTLVGKALFR